MSSFLRVISLNSAKANKNVVYFSLCLVDSKRDSPIVDQHIDRKADVLVAEIIGTLLLSESQLDYIEDARSKLLKDGGVIIPASGRQFVTLISMPLLERVFQVDHYRGLVRRAAETLCPTYLRRYSPRLNA